MTSKSIGIAQRGLELLGLMMIGEGVIGLIEPRRYSLFWRIGPKPLRELTEMFAEHPGPTRLLCIIEAAAGVWLSHHQIED